MAAAVGAFKTYESIGNREDLSDYISDISKTETPVLAAVGTGKKCTAVFHEWQTDSLAAASDSNAVVEAGDVTPQTSAPTTRLGNYTQILEKSLAVSSTQNAVQSAGRAREFAYQKTKRMKEIKRDLQMSVMANQGYVAGDATTARRMRGFESWIDVNTNYGTGGANATGPTAAATSGTARAFTEDQLKDVVAKCWNTGANPTTVYVGAINKQRASTFTGRTSARQNIERTRIQGGAHVYASDFGELKIVPNLFQPQDTAFILNPEYASVDYLQTVGYEDLAKTGHSERGFISLEATLCVKNPGAHGKIADLTTS
ncbi:MAG: DUF5309 domain-containing protein [Pseudomonadota bacterium]